jgi:hypothetical protein
MLVVVTLVALLGTAVALSLGARGDRALEAGAETLRDAVNSAAESAVLGGRAYGLFVNSDRYDLAVFDGERWQYVPEGGAALRPPLRVRGAAVNRFAGAATETPQLVFMPDGAHQVGELLIENSSTGEALAIEALLGGRFGLAPVAAGLR